MRQAATTADIMGRTFQSLFWVLGPGAEEDDMPADDDGPEMEAGVADTGLEVKWRNL